MYDESYRRFHAGAYESMDVEAPVASYRSSTRALIAASKDSGSGGGGGGGEGFMGMMSKKKEDKAVNAAKGSGGTKAAGGAVKSAVKAFK